jgi:hypothetical protein
MAEYINPQWRLPNEKTGNNQGYSMAISASNNRVSTGYFLPSGTKPKSISYWFKNTDPNGWSTTGYNYTIHGGSLSLAGNGFGMGTIGSSFGSYLWFIGHSTGDYLIPVSATGVMTTDVWYHIVVTYDNSRTNNLHFYLDGVKIDETNETLDTGSANSVKIGSSATGGGNQGGRFMEITDVCIFDHALSDGGVATGSSASGDVGTLYNSGNPGNPMALASPPKAYYPLGNSAHTGANYLTPNGALQDYVFNFDGGDDYINSGSTSYLNGLSNFTFSSWVNISTFGTYDAIAGDWSYSATASLNKGHFMITTGVNDGSAAKIRIFIKNAGADGGNSMIITDDYILNTGKWYHVLFTYNSGTGGVYVNGVPYTVTNYGTIPTSLTSENSDFIIGKWQNIGGRFFEGKISNVQIFNTALTDGTGGTVNQIETLYNNGSPLTSMSGFTSLQGWWKLDASATYDSSTATWTIPDDSSNSNDGTSWWMTQANLLQSDLLTTSSYSPYALNFDGNDYINCGNDSSLVPSSLTISLWFKTSGSASAIPRLINKSYGGSPYDSYFIRINNNVLNFKIGVSSASVQIAGATNVVDGNWHHVVGTYDGSQLKLYLDGNSEATPVSETRAIIENTTYNLTIGCELGAYGFSWPFTGDISNVSIFNSALTASQIRKIYNEGRPSNLHNFSGTAPVAWWQLGSNSSWTSPAWTVLDEIGSNNGTSSSMMENAIVDGVGTSGNGVSVNMGSANNISGSSPSGEANSLSVNMTLANIAGGVN